MALDLWSATNKCGYVGEMIPRCILDSNVGDSWPHQATHQDYFYLLLVDFIHQLVATGKPEAQAGGLVVENVLGSTLLDPHQGAVRA